MQGKFHISEYRSKNNESSDNNSYSAWICPRKYSRRYSGDGTYGGYCNSDKPSLRENIRFMVLDLGVLQNKLALLAAVMFSLIIYTEDKVYRLPCTQKSAALLMKGGGC